ncbi:diacylglycerol/lipid kinase family protein [Pseudomonas sp.]|uniref:diacylglycerol/lipid kinase family protein n=1 Tax=Pseudomonas sp. TaxID=306 RepID=UPI00272C6AA5|nr:diacylglycerol kinase family protein [Pseudomonas sp.]
MNSPGDEPGHSTTQQSLRGDEPFFIVHNRGSGRGDSERVQDTIRSVLAEGGRSCEILPVQGGDKLLETAATAIDRARAEGGIVVAAGGDGTLNAVAQAVLGSGLPFGILPQGTFNYFGRTHGISQDTEQAARCLLDAQIRPVQVGLINDRLFLVNASFGLYPKILEDREQFKQRYGRSRWVALWSALVTLMQAHRQLSVQLEFGEQVHRLRTPSVVVDNNALQLEQMGIDEVDDLTRNHLVAMAAKPVGTLALYGILFRGLASRLGEADNVLSFSFNRMTARLGSRRRIKVAMDGEICFLNTPLQFRVAEQRLPLLVPRQRSSAEMP